VQRVFGDQVIHVYFPYDLSLFIQGFLKHFKPAIALIMETELWPNLLWVCEKSRVPVLIINACLSLRSLGGYQRFKILSAAMMNRITRVCAQTEEEGERFLSLGLKPDRLCITGNLKFDQLLPVGIGEQSQVLREQWGSHRLVWIVASTHQREEAIILEIFKILRESFSDLLLVIAPRHPDRCLEVANLIRAVGYEPVIRSMAQVPHMETAVYLVDTLGELNLFYSASDVAFVGGRLVPNGGHNVLEPALFAVPILVGPYMFNCLEVMNPLKNVGALVQISDQAGLMSALATWLSDPVARKQAGLQAQHIVEENRGAVSKTIACILEVFDF
jgi:3-deoxy-D-manno-octulosonic-acid transferase